MTAHLSGGRIERYLAHELPVADLLALHAHLESCPECREALAQAALDRQSTSASPLFSESIDPHLMEDEMVAFVARRMPDARRAKAVAHLAGCELCRDSVASMESVSDRNNAQAADVRIRRRPLPGWLTTVGSAAAILLISVMIYFRAREERSTPSSPAVASPTIASLRDAGGTIGLAADGALRGLPGATPEDQALVRDALSRGVLPTGPGITTGAPGTLRAPGNAPQADFSLIAPVGARVLTDRPDFTWQPGRDVTAYEVLVTNEALDPLARSGRIQATHWTPETALPRGVTLLWQVRAWHGEAMVSVPAPPDPPARFEIAPLNVVGRIQQLRAADHPSHLLIAAICAREGLRDEAAKELEILARENPGSPLVGKLETSVVSWK